MIWQQPVSNQHKVGNAQHHQRNTDHRWTKETKTVCLRGTLQHTNDQDIGAGTNQRAGATQYRGITEWNQQFGNRQLVASRPILNQRNKNGHHGRIANNRTGNGHRPHNSRNRSPHRTTIAKPAHNPPVQRPALFQRRGDNIETGNNKQCRIREALKGFIRRQHAKHQ